MPSPDRAIELSIGFFGLGRTPPAARPSVADGSPRLNGGFGPASFTRLWPKFFRIQGAREHNLKDLDLELPRDRLVVLTGLSGSGKS